MNLLRQYLNNRRQRKAIQAIEAGLVSQPDYARRRGYRFTGDKRAKWLAKAAELEAR